MPSRMHRLSSYEKTVSLYVTQETVTLHPVDGSFIRLAERFVDPAFGCAAGYNYFMCVTACTGSTVADR